MICIEWLVAVPIFAAEVMVMAIVIDRYRPAIDRWLDRIEQALKDRR